MSLLLMTGLMFLKPMALSFCLPPVIVLEQHHLMWVIGGLIGRQHTRAMTVPIICSLIHDTFKLSTILMPVEVMGNRFVWLEM